MTDREIAKAIAHLDGHAATLSKIDSGKGLGYGPSSAFTCQMQLKGLVDLVALDCDRYYAFLTPKGEELCDSEGV